MVLHLFKVIVWTHLQICKYYVLYAGYCHFCASAKRFMAASKRFWSALETEEKRWTDFRWRSVLLSNYYSMLVGYVNVCEYFTKNQLSRLFLNFPFFFPHLLQFFGVIEVQINKFKSIPKRKRVHISKQRPWCERIWGDLASGVLHS